MTLGSYRYETLLFGLFAIDSRLANAKQQKYAPHAGAVAGVPPEKQFSGKAASEYAKRLAEDRAPKPTKRPRKG